MPTQFNRYFIAAICIFIFLGVAPTSPAEPRDVGFIDSHVHLNDVGPGYNMQITLMREHKIEAAVIFLGGESSNESILEASERWPSQFIPFASVSPEKLQYAAWWKYENVSAIVGELNRLLSTGKYRGVGEMNIVHFDSKGFPETRYSPVGKVMTGVMDLLATTYPKLPIMVHCEVTYVKELSKMLATYEKTKVIWAHGGYASLAVIEQMLKAHTNLTIELSMRMFEGHPRSPDFWILKEPGHIWPQWLTLIQNNPSRFIVGTDATNAKVNNKDKEKARSVQLLLSQLKEPARTRVARENLQVLLNESRSQ